MYYFILLVLGAIILFVGWPRTQLGSNFSARVTEQRMEQLERGLADLEGKLESIMTELDGYLTAPAVSRPLSGKGLTCYQAIQQDWQNGISLPELCRRYQLLRGEVELILDLLGEGTSHESRYIYRVHSDGSEPSCPGSEGREPS